MIKTKRWNYVKKIKNKTTVFRSFSPQRNKKYDNNAVIFCFFPNFVRKNGGRNTLRPYIAIPGTNECLPDTSYC